LLMVELDRMPGEENPRVTIRSVEQFHQLASASRMELVVDAQDTAAVEALAELLLNAKGGRSEVFLRAPIAGGKAARLFVGDDYLIGADQVDAIALIPGIVIHRFERMEPKADGYRARSRRSGFRLVAATA
jgi:DNA polymerase-3 subunit alpha